MTQGARPTGPEEATDPREVLATLRPQAYGNSNPQKIRDPLVEPLWAGVRTLAAVDARGAVLVDADGDPVPGMSPIVDALGESLQADGVVLDGFLTKQTAHAAAVLVWPDEMPSLRGLVGLRKNRAMDTVALKEDALAARSFVSDEAVSFVATDLLWLDDTSLLDVPLLERRRLLESVIAESDVVRVGAFVRPPIDSWVTSWRSMGFAGLTYKAANSHYLPGQPNPDWVITGMPRR
jgi:bifunctional non-homologous end joining protein LigD